MLYNKYLKIFLFILNTIFICNLSVLMKRKFKLWSSQKYHQQHEKSPVPDLPLCLGLLKHRASLARGGLIFLPPKKIMMDFCLCGAVSNLKAFCFGAISDIMIELITYWSVPQSRQSWQWLSGIETKLLGASGYWQLKSWRWIHAYVVQF